MSNLAIDIIGFGIIFGYILNLIIFSKATNNSLTQVLCFFLIFIIPVAVFILGIIIGNANIMAMPIILLMVYGFFINFF